MNAITTIIIIVTVITKATEGDITCIAVSTPQESTVTCSFGVDVSQTKHNFNVKFFYPNITADGDTILMCNYLRAGGIECREGPGITFDYVITDKLVVKGPPRRQRGGVYMCQVTPRLGVPIVPCNVTHRDATTTSTTSKEPGKTDSVENSKQTTVAILVLCAIIATLFFLIIIVGIFFVVICRRRIMQQIRGMGGQDQSQKPTKGSGTDTELGTEMSEHTALLLGNANPDRDQNSGKQDSLENVTNEDPAAAVKGHHVPQQPKEGLFNQGKQDSSENVTNGGTAAAVEGHHVPQQPKKRGWTGIFRKNKPSSGVSNNDKVSQQTDTDTERGSPEKVSEREKEPIRDPTKAEEEQLLPQHQHQQQQQHPQQARQQGEQGEQQQQQQPSKQPPGEHENQGKQDSSENVTNEGTAAAVEGHHVPQQPKKRGWTGIFRKSKPSSGGFNNGKVSQQTDTDPERGPPEKVSEREKVPARDPTKAEEEQLLPQHQHQQQQQHPQQARQQGEQGKQQQQEQPSKQRPGEHTTQVPDKAAEQTPRKEAKKKKK